MGDGSGGHLPGSSSSAAPRASRSPTSAASRSSTASPSRSTRGCSSRGRRRSCSWTSRSTGSARPLTEAPRPRGTRRRSGSGTWARAVGAIAVALAVRAAASAAIATTCGLSASDVSADALAVAVENAVAHGVADRIDAGARRTCWTRPRSHARSDLLVANLPYIPSDVIPTSRPMSGPSPRSPSTAAPTAWTSCAGCCRAAAMRRCRVALALLEMGADQGEPIDRRWPAPCCRAGAVTWHARPRRTCRAWRRIEGPAR